MKGSRNHQNYPDQ